MNENLKIVSFFSDYSNACKSKISYETFSFEINEQINKIHSFANQIQIEKDSVFLAAIAILIQKYTKQNEFQIGKRTELGLTAIDVMIKDNISLLKFLKTIDSKCSYKYENCLFNVCIKTDCCCKDIPSGTDLLFSFQNNLIELTYNSSLFNKLTIQYMVEQLINIFEQILNTDDKFTVEDIETSSEKEKELFSLVFNSTTVDYPSDKTVVEIFEEVVSKYPNRRALKYESETLTFNEMNRRVNAIGQKLRNMGVGPNEFVLLYTKRSMETLLGMFGVMKAGGAYIPIDILFPEDRIKYIINDCHPKVILTYNTIINTDVPVLDLGELDKMEVLEKNLEHINSPTDYIYSIYTSGTTGQPKGVIVGNRSVVNFCFNNIVAKAMVSNCEAIYANNRVCFDISLIDLHMPLLNGITVIISKNVEDFKGSEGENNLGIVTTPTKMKMFLNNTKTTEILKSSKIVVIGAEKFEQSLYEEIAKYTDAKIFNAYGPTEATCAVLFHEVIDSHYIPLGQAIPNSKMYVADGNNLCGICIPGELYIAGDCLAIGYNKSDKLNGDKFILNPFGEGIIYKSGDLVRRLPNGDIDFLGRIDDQVKIRGHRIELTEIESVLRNISDIKDVVVITKIDKDNALALYAYIISDKQINFKTIKNELRKFLPEYMVPLYMMQIDYFPTNMSGKLKKDALPDILPEFVTEYISPTNNTERLICDIFIEILKIDNVSIYDNFFEIGGHSLHAITAVNQIEEMTGKRIELKDFFRLFTPKAIADYLLKNNTDTYVPIPKAHKNMMFDMSSAQKRIFKDCAMRGNSLAYNIPLSFATEDNIDFDKLKKALQDLINRHEILRTEFIVENMELMQRIKNNVDAKAVYISNDFLSDKELLKRFIQPFNLEQAPLIRLALVKRIAGYLILIDVHHIVCDGISIKNLINELSCLYNEETLAIPNIQYSDYSEWMKTRNISQQKSYWLKEFSDKIPLLKLPYDFEKTLFDNDIGSMQSRIIDKNLLSQIKYLARKTDTTEYMIYLSSLMVFLGKLCNQNDIIIGTPVSARIHSDTDKMIGMFVNTIAIRGNPQPHKSYIDFLLEIKEKCLSAYENQEYPFDELLSDIFNKKTIESNSLFNVMMVLQNYEEIELKIKGIQCVSCVEHNGAAKFDLTFNFVKRGQELFIELEYNNSLFIEESITLILSKYIDTLLKLTEAPEISIIEL